MEDERNYAQEVTDKVDDAMLFDYPQVLDTIANSAKCKKAIQCLCMLTTNPNLVNNARNSHMRDVYAADLIRAIAEDMRVVFE